MTPLTAVIDAFLRERGLDPSLAGELAARIEAEDESTFDWVDGADDALPASGRYADEGAIGAGGMGAVRRVRDRELGRTCAFKTLLPDHAGRAHAVARFVDEARVAAQLQHPNIPPVYDTGRLPDGRPWFTMKEVRGETLTARIRAAHRGGRPTDGELRALCSVFSKVCDAVGYAHARGVVHRDLKPDNAMIGEHGEVWVLDWGIAKVVGAPEPDVGPELELSSSRGDGLRTRVGGVIGTPAYMPPEQARGEVDAIDARSDVWALGAMLYEILAGRPPYRAAGALATLRKVLAGPPEPLPAAGLPEPLRALCAACMSPEQSDRASDGAAVGRVVRDWLDGVRRRETALGVVSEADASLAEQARLRAHAAALREAGARALEPVPPWAPEEEKAAGWALLDDAARDEIEATRLELRREALLQAALTHAPDLDEAHVALVEIELERHRAAERERDASRATRAEVRLAEHVAALDPSHPVAARVRRHLDGAGALSLRTDPAGAEVELFRYVTRRRRLVAERVGSLGRTPLREVPLPMGSYLCVLRHPDRAELRYPVRIGREHHWDGVPPGGRGPLPVSLPMPDALGPDDVPIAEGWAGFGGDPAVSAPLPARTLWCDRLVVRRFPVTNREYIAFLDDLVAHGREAEALVHQPRERAMGGGQAVYGRGADGRFELRPDSDGDIWRPDWPVVLIDWASANAFADWEAARTGLAWRLPGELEWEKAARGVDGRFYPWGDFLDPSWACMRGSHPDGRMVPSPVTAYPVDESVYGVRGLSGNVEDWCADAFDPAGPPTPERRVLRPPADRADGVARVHRGGFWGGSESLARSAWRLRSDGGGRGSNIGMRLIRGAGPGYGPLVHEARHA